MYIAGLVSQSRCGLAANHNIGRTTLSNRILLSIIAGLLLALFGLLLIAVYQRGKLDAVPPSVRVSVFPDNPPPAQPTPAFTPANSSQPAAQSPSMLPMPLDVAEYLDFLKGIEEHKQQIIARQLGESRASYIALSASGNNRQNVESSRAVLNQSQQLEGEWDEFTASFRQNCAALTRFLRHSLSIDAS